MGRFWNFSNETDTAVDLSIEGTLLDDEDWMSWFFSSEQLAKNTPGGFREAIKEYAGKTLNVRINSYGGDVFAGVGLYDALIEHKRTGGKVITNGEKVYSAAVMPFLAGDERNMYPGGMLMVHNPLMDIYGYASDLREAADSLDKVKECILNIYEEATGVSRKHLSELMDAETEMTPQEAVAEKMATGILKTGSATNLSHVKELTAVMNAGKICQAGIMNVIHLAGTAGKGTGMATNTTFKTVEDLRKAYPDLAKQADEAEKNRIDKAVKDERARLSALDAMDDGSTAIHKIVQNAKEEGKTAEEIKFYVDTIKDSAPKEPEPQAGRQEGFLEDAIKDFKDSGAANVKTLPQPPAGEDSKKAAENAAINSAVAEAFNKKGE